MSSTKLRKAVLQEGGTLIIAWVVLSFVLHVAKCSPLGQDYGRGWGLRAEPEPLPENTNSAKPATGFFSGFVSSFSMIIVSELGDKTFFIAAVMAMKHPRLVVFSGAMSALAFMTIFSALFGYVTTFIPRVYTYYISTALFAIFGIKMLYDGALMSSDEGSEELEEVHMSLMKNESSENTPLTSSSSEESLNNLLAKNKFRLALRRVLSNCFSKVYIQALTMTFLAEWGDRSQLATVVLAARENIIGICVGGTLGHFLCTGLAVLGGRILAQKISVKTVTIIGGFVFLGFAVVSLFLDPNS